MLNTLHAAPSTWQHWCLDSTTNDTQSHAGVQRFTLLPLCLLPVNPLSLKAAHGESSRHDASSSHAVEEQDGRGGGGRCDFGVNVVGVSLISGILISFLRYIQGQLVQTALHCRLCSFCSVAWKTRRKKSARKGSIKSGKLSDIEF